MIITQFLDAASSPWAWLGCLATLDSAGTTWRWLSNENHIPNDPSSLFSYFMANLRSLFLAILQLFALPEASMEMRPLSSKTIARTYWMLCFAVSLVILTYSTSRSLWYSEQPKIPAAVWSEPEIATVESVEPVEQEVTVLEDRDIMDMDPIQACWKQDSQYVVKVRRKKMVISRNLRKSKLDIVVTYED